jgi:hypothetical protein
MHVDLLGLLLLLLLGAGLLRLGTKKNRRRQAFIAGGVLSLVLAAVPFAHLLLVVRYSIEYLDWTGWNSTETLLSDLETVLQRPGSLVLAAEIDSPRILRELEVRLHERRLDQSECERLATMLLAYDTYSIEYSWARWRMLDQLMKGNYVSAEQMHSLLNPLVNVSLTVQPHVRAPQTASIVIAAGFEPEMNYSSYCARVRLDSLRWDFESTEGVPPTENTFDLSGHALYSRFFNVSHDGTIRKGLALQQAFTDPIFIHQSTGCEMLGIVPVPAVGEGAIVAGLSIEIYPFYKNSQSDLPPAMTVISRVETAQLPPQSEPPGITWVSHNTGEEANANREPPPHFQGDINIFAYRNARMLEGHFQLLSTSALILDVTLKREDKEVYVGTATQKAGESPVWVFSVPWIGRGGQFDVNFAPNQGFAEFIGIYDQVWAKPVSFETWVQIHRNDRVVFYPIGHPKGP